MNRFERRPVGLVLLLAAMVALIPFVNALATASNGPGGSRSSSLAATGEILAQAAVGPAAVVPQPAQQDPCLHCHIVGENKGIWTPLARWSLFSSMGLLFVFGCTERQRLEEPTLGATYRRGEWVDERYEVSSRSPKS
jgi:hypothetical protein